MVPLSTTKQTAVEQPPVQGLCLGDPVLLRDAQWRDKASKEDGLVLEFPVNYPKECGPNPVDPWFSSYSVHPSYLEGCYDADRRALPPKSLTLWIWSGT